MKATGELKTAKLACVISQSPEVLSAPESINKEKRGVEEEKLLYFHLRRCYFYSVK
jgi:hypothetical protein